MATSRRSNSGSNFANMDPEQRREIARRGGQASDGARSQSYEHERIDDEDRGRYDSSSRGNSAGSSSGRGRREEDEMDRYSSQRGNSQSRYDDEYEDEEEDYSSRDESDEDYQPPRSSQGRSPSRFENTFDEEYSAGRGSGSQGRMQSRDSEEDYRGGRSNQEQQSNQRGETGRGFESMDPQRRREIARQGGQASPSGRGRSQGSEGRR